MLERLEGHPASTAFRERADAASLGPSSLRFDFPDASLPGALDPRAVCRKLDGLLPRDRTVVVDTGQLCEYPVESMTFRSPDSLLWMMDFGAVGSGLGPAIGATIGRPDRLTVLFVGDGGLFMTLGDLDLAVRDQVPVLVVCMNDRAYGSEMYHMLDHAGPASHAAAGPCLSWSRRGTFVTAVRPRSRDNRPVSRERRDRPMLISCGERDAVAG